MSTNLFIQQGYPLLLLMETIDIGDIGLPDIQRPFVWKPTRVRDLFDSMYKGFPVGYLLFWQNVLGNGARQIGSDSKQKIPHLLIVDGQQRLTSLYAVLKGKPVLRDFKWQKIQIAFRPRDAMFEVADAAVQRDPEFIPDISKLWSGEVAIYHLMKDFIEHLRAKRPVTEEEECSLLEAIGRLNELRNYPFTALVLSAAVSEEQVAQVFVRINSQGVNLNQADFILTLMSVFWDDGRADLERFCRDARHPSATGPSPFNYFIQPQPGQLLLTSVGLGFRRARLEHVYSILRGKDLDTEEFSEERRITQFRALEDAQGYSLNLINWHEFFNAIRLAGYRSNAMISSQVGLLYAYLMFLIGKRDFHVDTFRLRSAIARWFSMTALTARYSSSPETAMESDLARLRAIDSADGFVEVLDNIIAGTFTEDFWNITLPNELATSAARSPSLFAYQAAQHLLDAEVLFSPLKVAELTDPAVKGTKSPVERHHLFARAYLRGMGITDLREVNQIANFAWVEWKDNIDISDKAPSEYVPDFEARFAADLTEMYYWHALPDEWTAMPYPSFLKERRRLIAKVIRDGFSRLARVGS